MTAVSAVKSTAGATPGAAMPAPPGDDSAIDVFARLIGLLGGDASAGSAIGSGAAEASGTTPARAAPKWTDPDARPDELWAAIWFPTAPPVTAALPDTAVPIGGTPAAGDAKPDPAALSFLSAIQPPETSAPDLRAPVQDADSQLPVAAPQAADAEASIPAPLWKEAAALAALADPNADGAAVQAADGMPHPHAKSAESSTDAAGAMQFASTMPPDASRDVAPPSRPPVDMTSPQAPLHIAERVTWSVGEGLSEVRLQLQPDELGAIDVHLRIEGDRVHVAFHAADAGVRDVVQTSLPNLSAMLSARGLQLDQAQVFSQSRQTPTPVPVPQVRGVGAVEETATETVVRRVRRLGLFDDWV